MSNESKWRCEQYRAQAINTAMWAAIDSMAQDLQDVLDDNEALTRDLNTAEQTIAELRDTIEELKGEIDGLNYEKGE